MFSNMRNEVPAYVAFDVGTSMTRMGVLGSDIMAEEPSVNVETPQALFPLRQGIVVDPNGTAKILRRALYQNKGLAKFLSEDIRSLLCLPSDADDRERLALWDSAVLAGLKPIVLVSEPWAAAIGAGMSLALPYAQMIVDIGAGVCDVAIFKSSQVIFSSTKPLDPTGCGFFEKCEILAYVKEALGFLSARDAVEVFESGVVLTGGGALLTDLVPYLERQTQLPVSLAPNPMHAVIRGARILLSDWVTYHRPFQSEKEPSSCDTLLRLGFPNRV